MGTVLYDADKEFDDLFGSDGSQSNVEETTKNSEVDNNKDVDYTKNDVEDNTGTDIISDVNKESVEDKESDKPDDNKSDGEEDNTITDESEEGDISVDDLEKELSELEDILQDNLDDKDNKTSDEDKQKLIEQVTKAIKENNKLKSEINEMHLKNAESDKFGANANLDPELVIINAHYMKAKEGDEIAKKKLLDMFSQDLGVELSDKRELFVNDTISGSIDSKPIEGGNDSGIFVY